MADRDINEWKSRNSMLDYIYIYICRFMVVLFAIFLFVHHRNFLFHEIIHHYHFLLLILLPRFLSTFLSRHNLFRFFFFIHQFILIPFHPLIHSFIHSSIHSFTPTASQQLSINIYLLALVLCPRPPRIPGGPDRLSMHLLNYLYNAAGRKNLFISQGHQSQQKRPGK